MVSPDSHNSVPQQLLFGTRNRVDPYPSRHVQAQPRNQFFFRNSWLGLSPTQSRVAVSVAQQFYGINGLGESSTDARIALPRPKFVQWKCVPDQTPEHPGDDGYQSELALRCA
uniref:Uncharacterized protein n=1 Tax=Paramoeba aestuarina TaxID=180227 RepID=A0A7S4KF15_9EUKA|mmetsp:Transcript_17973/g.28129  ORF Transcript_17973/g.28129 Transcript_17973/m.28129 type:complete len:113 (+) Transcript_17973:271-609(+)